jgi:hypothetical protein
MSVRAKRMNLGAGAARHAGRGPLIHTVWKSTNWKAALAAPSALKTICTQF